ncbi:Maf family protein [Eubacteriales bacterium mix99]|jgi:septum formation protein
MSSLICLPKQVVLASASPRRRELLGQMGIRFTVVPSSLKEDPPSGDALEYVCRLAGQKARDSAGRISEDALVIGADTAVVKNGKILGKPRNGREAVGMLQFLQGGWHDVVTGVALIDRRLDYMDLSHACTHVEMIHLDRQQIQKYIDSGEYADKAGGYGIQGMAAAFIPRIEGCYFNVVGLPVALLYTMLLRYTSCIKSRGRVIETDTIGNNH